ncbi:glutathione-dependent formaldehyde-activating [Xylaria intraflava]|nr:glutathione-dependent formaldehyde-activating [Xylaria intraflava]
MEARCKCGAVRFTTPVPKPLALYICHCADCRRQAGSTFGTSAIFPRFELPKADMLSCYTRLTQSGHTLYCYFCRGCGTRLLHATPGKKVVSVKGMCLSDIDWDSATHIWTKSAMVPIPEGSESLCEEPAGSDYSISQSASDETASSANSVTEAEAAEAKKLGTIHGACELSGPV